MLKWFSSPRRALIVAHDLLVTAIAVVASCYIRFEVIGVEERLDTLYSFLPAFVLYAGVIYFLFHLYEAKWRFASLPDLMNIVRASSVLAVSLLVIDYFLVVAEYLRPILLRQDHDRALLDPADRAARADRASPTAISAIRARGIMRARWNPIRR